MALTTGLGQLGALLGGGAGAGLQQQQNAYQNAYINNWITTTSASSASAITISGVTYSQDELEYDIVRDMVKVKDEFAWLRGRVAETCWRQAA